jgi:hypothetical protein
MFEFGDDKSTVSKRSKIVKLNKRHSEAPPRLQNSVTPIRNQDGMEMILSKMRNTRNDSNLYHKKSSKGNLTVPDDNKIPLKKFYPEKYFERVGY